MTSPSYPLSVAVLGCGFGKFHINGLLNEPDKFALRALCDQNPAMFDDVKRHPALPAACAFHNDYQAILDDPSIDAVFVSLPHHLHESVCLAAANRGKHIMLDKPIARTLDEADHIIQAADDNDITLMIAHQMRFYPFVRKMHDLIVSGELGTPLYAETCHHQNFNPPADANWRSKSSVGGGCLIGSGIHNIDLMRWFFGPPAEVFAYAVRDSRRLEAEMAVSASIRFQQGTLVNFTCNWGSHGAMSSYEWGEWAVFGDKGDVVCKGDKMLIGRQYASRIDELGGEHLPPQESIWTHFANCIVNHTEPLIHGRDALASLALVQDIYKSIETGTPVPCRG